MARSLLEKLRKSLGLELNVAVLGFTGFLISLGMGVWLWFLTLYVVEELGASSVELGIIHMVSLLCFIAGGFFGFLADSLGRRPLIIIGTSIYSLILMFMGLSRSWMELALLMGFLRFIHSCYIGSIMAMASESVEHNKRGSALAFVNLMSYAGLIPAPYMGSWLHVIYASYQKHFIFGALLVAIAALVRTAFLKETLCQKVQPKAYLKELMSRTSQSLRNTKLRYLIAFSAIYAFSANLTIGVQGLWLLYATEVSKLTSSDIGLWGSIYQTCFMAIMMPAGKLIDRIGFKKMLIIGIPCEALASALFIYARGLLQVTLISVLDAVFSSIDIVALQVAVATTSPSEYRAGALSLYSSAFYGASSPSTYIGGSLYAYNKQTPFLLSAGLEALTALLLLKMLRGDGRST